MANKKTKKILVVEDDTSLNSAIVDTLKREKFDVDTAFDGKEGLEKALADRPDLILLDLLMPNYDGHEFMLDLRQDDWGQSARVIILTNFSMAEENVAKTVIQSHPDLFLVKSSTKLTELIENVNQVLGK